MMMIYRDLESVDSSVQILFLKQIGKWTTLIPMLKYTVEDV